MSNVDIARALKDKEYFNSLTQEQQAEVQAAHPAGKVDLSDETLDSVSGGIGGGVGKPLTTGTGTSISSPSSSAVHQDTVCNCNC